MIGQPVEMLTGERIGKVNDLVIDPQTGRIVFVVLASGGFAGVGAHLHPVPPGAIAPAPAKRGVMMMDITSKRWKAAPRMNKERMQELENPFVTEKAYAYYNQPLLLPTGRVPNAKANPKNGRLELASELIGESVFNRRKGEVGRVADLAVNLKDFAPARAVVEPIGSDESFSVPMNAFDPDEKGGRLYLEDERPFQRVSRSDALLQHQHPFATFNIFRL